jgi:hypothetical protein
LNPAQPAGVAPEVHVARGFKMSCEPKFDEKLEGMLGQHQILFALIAKRLISLDFSRRTTSEATVGLVPGKTREST